MRRKKGFAATMNRWDPLRNLLSIQEMVNRLFDDMPGRYEDGELTRAGMWSPAVDICETEEEFLVSAELPELEQSDIDIRVSGQTLVIEGERNLRRTLVESCHRIERSYGTFRRSFLLPQAVDRDKMTTVLRDGILRIVLPKKSGITRRKIEVTGT